MSIRDGIYQLVSGNGESRLVTLEGRKINPYDLGGEIIGRLEVIGGPKGDDSGRTFSLSLIDQKPILDDTHIHHAGASYRYRVVLA
ncbi:hypothetical protein ACIZ1P_20040 [Pseudomonas guariconensis]|uniref:hypothetical protein n=1 Tax=Pseudomonas guariconensis TaxID=1288410 RepID=UPI003F68BF06